MPYNVKRHAVTQPEDPSIRYIPLTQGLHAIVDERDYSRLSKYNWAATKNGYKFYASRSIKVDGKRKPVYMHRVILCGLSEVDHRNGNGLDNRRKNLREATRSQNNVNSGPQRHNTTGFRGVSANGPNFRASLTVQGKQISLGTRKDKEEAAKLYDEAARIYYGSYAHLNFPPNEK